MNRVKSVVIFGGSGFIGQELARQFSRNGFRVIIADINAPKNSETDFRYCDIRKEIQLELDFTPDVAINLAAIHRTPGHAPEEYYSTNFFGSNNVLNWVDKFGIKNVVFTSSISVYGESESQYTESSIPSPTSHYGKSKFLAEAIYREWQNYDFQNRRLIICRPAVIFGIGENGNFTRLAHSLKRKFFVYPGRKDTLKSSGYVKDLCRSILFVLESSQEKYVLYNFCFPKIYSIEEICLSFSKVADYKVPKLLKISTLIEILSKFRGPWSSLIMRIRKLQYSTNVSPEYLLEAGFIWNFDLEMALSDWMLTSNSNSKEFA